MKSNITSFSVAALLVVVSTYLEAEIIFQDDFSGSASVDLNGSALDMTTAGQTWRAHHTFKADGSIVRSSNNCSAYLDYTLLAGSVYTLTADLTVEAGTNNNNWLGVGFVRNTSNLRSRHPDSSYGIAWGIHRDSDTVSSDQEVFGGPRTHNLLYSSELNTASVTYQLILDAADADNVLFSASINGSEVVTKQNLGSLSKLDIQGLGFSYDSSAVGRIDNFSFSSIP